jgi:regulator of RNase E activity RraA
MMSTPALKLGATGAVLNGYSRDTKAVLRLNFPTFSWGSYGQDSGPRYKVVDFRIPIEIGNVLIKPGDILFGDVDGVCCIPRQVEAEVFTKALGKARSEKVVRKALEEGSSAIAAFEKYGIL